MNKSEEKDVSMLIAVSIKLANLTDRASILIDNNSITCTDTSGACFSGCC